MRKFKLALPSALPVEGDDAARSELIDQIVVGKLRVSAACARHGFSEEQVLDWLRSFRRATLAAFDEQLKQRLVAQGMPASAFGSAELAGTLSELSVADVLQMLGLTGKSAVLRVLHDRGTQDGVESRIWCANGAIVDAESGRLRGEAAVYRILGLERGQFFAELRPSQRVRRVRASTSALLLEAARRKDESVALRQQLGDDRHHFELGPRVADAGGSPSEAEVALLALFAPPCSLRDALEQSELGDFESLTLLCRLIADGWLVDTGLPAHSPSSPAQSMVRWRGEQAQPAGLRWALEAIGTKVLQPAASWINSRLAARDL
jgi:transposase-like protein